MKNETDTDQAAQQTVPSGSLAGEAPVVSSSQNQLKSPISKISYTKILIPVVLVLILGLTAIVLIVARKAVPSVTKDQSGQKQRIENTQAKQDVKTIVGYVESQRKPDGSYSYYSHLDLLCSDSKTQCQFTETKSQQELGLAWTALAHFAGYKTNNSSVERDQTKRDIVGLINNCKSQKNNCLWVLTQPEIIYKDMKDPQILQFITDEASILLASTPSDNLMLQGIEARELALAYEITGENKFLVGAKERLSNAQKTLTSLINQDLSPSKKFQPDTCWVTLGQAELGRIQNNNQDVMNAAAYLDQQKLLENPNKIFTPVVFQPCIETYYVIANALNSPTYKHYASQLLSLFLKNYFDSPSNKILYGEGGTTTFPPVKDTSKLQNNSSISDSSYTSYLLFLDIAK